MDTSTISISSSHELSAETKKVLEAKALAHFGAHPLSFALDASLGLGISIRFGDDELYYNLQHEVSHILQELLH